MSNIVENMKLALGVSRPSELAKLLGVERSTVSTWLKRGKVPIEHQIRCADLSGRTIDELMSGVFNKNKTSCASDGFVVVPRYDVCASAGHGSVVGDEEIAEYLSFSREWITNTLRVGFRNLAVISVKGDSMEPRLRDGDIVLLDTSVRVIEDNAIYALQLNGGLIVKRIQRFYNGSVRIISDNSSHYKEENLTADEAVGIVVVGRVVWSGGRM